MPIELSFPRKRESSVFAARTVLSVVAAFALISPAAFAETTGIEGLFGVEIRVALARSAVSSDIAGEGGLLVASAESGARLNTGSVDRIAVRRDRRGIKLNTLVFPVKSIRVEAQGGIVSFNGKRYRGYLVLWDNDKGTFDVVNHVPMEDYLRSVVAMEMPKSWPLEALKAQTVAARTYALYRRQENAGTYFDVETDVMDQVYGGVAVENGFTDAAVEGTSGLVLKYENQLVKAFFHANAGERTENGEEVFRGVDVPYLKSVPCRYAKQSPYYVWQLSIRSQEIENALSRAGLFSGKITGISAHSHTRTGRVRFLKVQGRSRSELVEATAFRAAIGSTRIKSTRFSLRKQGQTFTFMGTGYGHGVGLCQWGAKGMAEAGKNFSEILSHYYPGITVSKDDFIATPE
ncbi:MAG: SpoIID/LytB domain-containing protein [Nitrospinae bacterium]|nr:SpoIID/LytB domain-containing protein [Nitrospinota bacterium]